MTAHARPYTQAELGGIKTPQLKALCIATCKAEGITSGWVQTSDMDGRKSFLTSPEGTEGISAGMASSGTVANQESVRQAVRDELKALAESAAGQSTIRLATLGAKATTGSPAEIALARWCNYPNATRPVLLVGPSGSGKTTAARVWGKTWPEYFEYQCAPDDDKQDLFGGNVPNPVDGVMGFAWCDSHITAAFRRASKGEKTFLLIDEIYRLPKSTREAMLSALAPTLDGKYVLSTGRCLSVVDGVADVETLTVDCSDLAIVASSNAGAAYGLVEACPAEAERWAYTPCPTDWPFAQNLLQQVAKQIGWSLPNDLSVKLVKFGKATEALKASSELWHSASLRTLMRALAESKANDPASLNEALMIEGNTWAHKDGDGFPVKAQLVGLQATISAIL